LSWDCSLSQKSRHQQRAVLKKSGGTGFQPVP